MQTVKTEIKNVENGLLHFPEKLARDIYSTFDDEALCDLVRKHINEYEVALEVCSGSWTLDDIYRDTQNYDEPWGVHFDEEPRRSTSVGDIVVKEGKHFLVTSAGFTQLDKLF